MNLLRASAIVAAAMLTVSGYAQPRANTWYGKADLGGAIVQDTKVKDLFGPVAGDNEVKFDPGVRFGLGAGYNFTEWFALEGELGMSWNDVDKLGDANPVDAMLISVPFMVNARFQLPNPTRIRPYIGAGVGGSSSVLDMDRLDYGNVRVYGSASDVTFAWQGFAGVQFEVNENLNIGLEYHYIWTDSPQFDIDWGWYWNAPRDYLTLDDIETHTLSVVVSYTF
jgi:opacity protein-like surface antigen